MTKQEQKEIALKECEAIVELAYKKYEAITDLEYKKYEAKCKKIDEQPEDIKIIDGKRYKLMEEIIK